jgi:hypothetical protein
MNKRLLLVSLLLDYYNGETAMEKRGIKWRGGGLYTCRAYTYASATE